MSANGVEQFFNGLEAYVREAAEKPAKEQAAALAVDGFIPDTSKDPQLG